MTVHVAMSVRVALGGRVAMAVHVAVSVRVAMAVHVAMGVRVAMSVHTMYRPGTDKTHKNCISTASSFWDSSIIHLLACHTYKEHQAQGDEFTGVAVAVYGTYPGRANRMH